jgi:hypothetical protein
MAIKTVNWETARDSYCYPFDLNQFHRKKEFSSGFFNIKCDGYRESTIKFENYYQKNAPHHIEVFVEVLFWKLYSKREKGNKNFFDLNNWYNTAINTIKKASPSVFWIEITNFVENLEKGNISESKKNYHYITRNLYINNKLIIPLTFTALAYPKLLPMIDKVVMTWINLYSDNHNKSRNNQLKLFFTENPTVDSDFEKYIAWVKWCQDSAELLNENSNYNDWRPRDVEMAIFSKQMQGNGQILEILS